MSEKNREEGLINQRSENSVLFSLSNLAAAEESDGNSQSNFSFGSGGDQSGLIDLNTLARLGASGSEDGESEEGGMPVMFNVPRRSNVGLIIGICVLVVLLLAGAGLGYYFYVKSEEEKAAEIARLEEENRKIEEEAEKARELAAEKEATLMATKRHQIDMQQEMQKALEEAKQKAEQEAAEEAAHAGSGKKLSGRRPSGGTGGAPAVAGGGDAGESKPSGGSSLSPQAVKAALVDSNTKAKKCAKDGTLTVSFSLNPSGKASNVKATGGSFMGSATERCIITVIERHDFPKYSGKSQSVKYTYKL